MQRFIAKASVRCDLGRILLIVPHGAHEESKRLSLLQRSVRATRSRNAADVPVSVACESSRAPILKSHICFFRCCEWRTLFSNRVVGLRGEVLLHVGYHRSLPFWRCLRCRSQHGGFLFSRFTGGGTRTFSSFACWYVHMSYLDVLVGLTARI